MANFHSASEMIEKTNASPVTSSPVVFQKLFGLFELDATGIIAYSRDSSRLGYAAVASNATLIGRNFFDEVAPFDNVEEFRSRFKRFMKSSESTENFAFDCRIEQSIVPVKVKLARISEREFDERTELVIVDIRKL